jgi:hypothetical protein
VSESVHRSFDSSWTFAAADKALQDFSRNTRDAAFHVVLSHATRDQDRLMRKALADAGRAVILGGHDHHIGWLERDDDVWVSKNRSNLETVRVLLLLAGGDSAMQRLNDRYAELKEQAALTTDLRRQYGRGAARALTPGGCKSVPRLDRGGHARRARGRDQ